MAAWCSGGIFVLSSQFFTSGTVSSKVNKHHRHGRHEKRDCYSSHSLWAASVTKPVM